MTLLTRKTLMGKVGIAKVGNSRVGLIPIIRDRDPRTAGSSPSTFYGHRSVTVDETGLGFTEVE